MPRASLLWTTAIATALTLTVPSAPASSGGSKTAPASWLERARTIAELSEYRFSATPDDGFSAPNRAQGLRLRADTDGVRITPRRDDRGWDLGMALRGFGREGAMRSAGRATVQASGATVEQRRREAGLTEWDVNGARGIEQGYTIDARPSGDESGAPLVLEIALSGSLEARQDADGVV